ncbi:hypothetical protein CSA37_00185 [Candidatus Fermentibacteria bacterium]|nr:MAG: hypothetical protein CSA37_00185 [Candidatus Fermentibacteria bacterium]
MNPENRETDSKLHIGDTCPVVIIPGERRRRIYADLIDSEEDVSITVDVSDNLALLGVSAVDWAGLASVVVGELHHEGWNLDLLEGFTVERNGVRRGIIITGIILQNEQTVRGQKFRKDAEKLSTLLKRLAVGRAGIISLLNRSSDRVECYQGILEELDRIYYGNIPEGILGPSGQLVLFISSRSDQYLLARKKDDLAWIVKTNHDLVEKVRKKGGVPYYRIRNIRATSEHLTGINIVGYERDISFQKLITTLSVAWPGATVRHQRRYTTADGIVSIRVELTGPNGMSATREELKVVRSYLKKLLVSRGIDRLRTIHHYGGTEHIGRALLPLLIKECRTTGINQAYIAMESTTTFDAELKMLLVTRAVDAADIQEHDGKILTLVRSLSQTKGIGVKSFKSPTRRGDIWVDIFDFVVEREQFFHMEDAYSIVKQAVRESFGEFRDFDQGMRLNDVNMLDTIKQMLPEIPETVTTDFYYSLEDFLRASSPAEELAQHISVAFRTMNELLSCNVGRAVVNCEDVMGRKRSIATLFCVASLRECRHMEALLAIVRDFTVTASIIRWSGAVSVLLRVQRSSRGLPPEESEAILETITKRLNENG